MSRPPRWPARDLQRPATTGSPGPTARSWLATWPKRWCRWAGGARRPRSPRARCSSSRPWPTGHTCGGLPATWRWRVADLAAAAESVASMRSVLEDTRYRDQYHLPMVRLETELLLAQGRPAGALSAVEDALDRFDVLQTPRYTWPLLVAGARTCAATSARDDALLARAAALRDRLRARRARMPLSQPGDAAGARAVPGQ